MRLDFNRLHFQVRMEIFRLPNKYNGVKVVILGKENTPCVSPCAKGDLGAAVPGSECLHVVGVRPTPRFAWKYWCVLVSVGIKSSISASLVVALFFHSCS